MGRSAKEYCRPDQIVDGGGAVDMGVGARIKPEEAESSGMARMKTRNAGGTGGSQKPGNQEGGSRDIDEGSSGWDKIGKYGAEIVTSYKNRPKEGEEI